MADATAWVVVGPKPGGGYGSDFDPTHLLELTESDRASWRLFPLMGAQGERIITWVPASPDSFVHDAVLMMALHVLKDDKIRTAASQGISGINEERVDLNLPDRSSVLSSLYELCRPLPGVSLVVTVLSQSSLARVVSGFKDYEIPTRVCMEQ